MRLLQDELDQLKEFDHIIRKAALFVGLISIHGHNEIHRRNEAFEIYWLLVSVEREIHSKLCAASKYSSEYIDWFAKKLPVVAFYKKELEFAR